MAKQKDKWEEVKPEAWDYESEPELIGTLTKIESNIGPNLSKMYTIKKDNGSVISVWGSTILDSRFNSINEGERVKIEYLGKGKAKAGRNAPLLFKVYHSLAKHSENVLEEDIIED